MCYRHYNNDEDSNLLRSSDIEINFLIMVRNRNTHGCGTIAQAHTRDSLSFFDRTIWDFDSILFRESIRRLQSAYTRPFIIQFVYLFYRSVKFTNWVSDPDQITNFQGQFVKQRAGAGNQIGQIGNYNFVYTKMAHFRRGLIEKKFSPNWWPIWAAVTSRIFSFLWDLH